jgi:hypothetical protein
MSEAIRLFVLLTEIQGGSAGSLRAIGLIPTDEET